MKEIYLVNSHYSKKIKFIKVFILFLILTLLQMYIPIFHGNEIFMDQLKKEGVDLTTFYVPYKRILQFPQKFDKQLEEKAIKERYHLVDYKVRNVFDTVKGYYIESAKDTNFKIISKGKDLHKLKNGEVGVSEYYAYKNFGSIRNAIDKNIEVPVEYVVYEGILNEEKIYNDTLTYKIVSVYKNSGLNKRFLNILGNSDNAEDSNRNIRYSDTLIVNDEHFKDLYAKYITFDDNSHNLYKKYNMYFDEYDTQKEIYLRGRLNSYVENYNSVYIKSELIHKVLGNSTLSNNTTKFFVTFEFISILVLIIVCLIYLLYLQNKYLYNYRITLNLIGTKKAYVLLSTLFHELYLMIIGIVSWFIFNLLLEVIFEIRLVFLQDIFQFNNYIIRFIWLPILIYLFSVGLSYVIYMFTENRTKLIRINSKKPNDAIDRKFYIKRLLSLNTSKYSLLIIIVLIVVTSVFTINCGIRTMKDIYITSNPFKYDIYVSLKGKAVAEAVNNASASALLSVNSESLLSHHYGEGIENHKAMMVNAVQIYGDVETFFKKPKLGDYPKFQETIGDFVEKYPHQREFYSSIDPNEKIGFDMLVSNSIAKKLGYEIGSYGIIMLEELSRNVPQMYPISGITNIFSNDMSTVYLVPSLERQKMLKNFSHVFSNKDENYYSLMMVFDNNEGKEETIKKLKELKKIGDVKDLRVNDGKVRLNDLGELSTFVARLMMGITLLCYLVLLGAIFKAKESDDKLSQENNFKAYHNLGVDSLELTNAFRNLNKSALVVGTILGFIVYLTFSKMITEYIYEIMEVLR